MRQLIWIIGASCVSVKVRLKSDIQWEAPKQSRDLIATTIKTQLSKRDYPNQNQIERQW